MIDPRRLRILLAVATHGSVGAAAAAMHLTAPAVSQQLLALERETGVSLIDRSGRQVSLTAAGRLLARHGERIAAQLREAERDLAELVGRASGPVRLSAFQSVMSRPTKPLIRVSKPTSTKRPAGIFRRRSLTSFRRHRRAYDSMLLIKRSDCVFSYFDSMIHVIGVVMIPARSCQRPGSKFANEFRNENGWS